MASTVTWSLNVEEVEIGKYVEFSAEGLDSFEGMAVLIQLPNESTFLWGVQADGGGRVRDKIKLDSGLGQYLFCPKPACGYVVPRCAHINVCPCSVSKTDCSLIVEGDNQIVKGLPYSYRVSGLKPSAAITARISSNRDPSYTVTGVSDVQGNYIFEFTHNMAGTYSLVFSDGSCTSAPKIIDVVNSINEIPAIRSPNNNSCAASVDISIKFSKSKYAPQELGFIKASVCNRGPDYRHMALYPSFVMPGATITSMPIPPALGISGYRCEEYTILFNAGPGQDASYFASLSGSYECNTAIFTANGATTNAIVGNGAGVCSGVLQYFGTVSGAPNAEVNEEIPLSVQIYNSGNTVIEYGAVNSLTIPEGVQLVTPLPIATNPIEPGTAQSLEIKVKPIAAGAHTIQLPSDALVVKCTAGEIPLGTVGFVTINAA